MADKEKNCDKCDDTGYLDYAGFAMDECSFCDKGDENMPDKIFAYALAEEGYDKRLNEWMPEDNDSDDDEEFALSRHIYIRSDIHEHAIEKQQADIKVLQEAIEGQLNYVRQKYPNEDLHCPHLIKMDEALKLTKGNEDARS